jgi:hypothetical protein
LDAHTPIATLPHLTLCRGRLWIVQSFAYRVCRVNNDLLNLYVLTPFRRTYTLGLTTAVA